MNILSLTAVNYTKTKNIGDLVCNPMDYFDYDNVTRFCVRPMPPPPRHTPPDACPKADAYIFGGGGITTMVRKMADRDVTSGIKIAWGIGQSIRGETAAITNVLGDFDLVGSRDIGIPGTEWVPCVSCMSPLFDKEYEKKYDVAVWLNSSQAIHKFYDPVRNNQCSFADAISYIGSARKLVTTSYHGAYWATLLGIPAIIVRAYSTKFYQYKHQSVVSGVRNYLGDIMIDEADLIEQADQVFPEALEECREANVRFDEKVRTLLS